MNLQDYEKVCLDINESLIPCCRLQAVPFLFLKCGEKQVRMAVAITRRVGRAFLVLVRPFLSLARSFASQLKRGCKKPSSYFSRLRTFVTRTEQQWINAISILVTILQIVFGITLRLQFVSLILFKFLWWLGERSYSRSGAK